MTTTPAEATASKPNSASDMTNSISEDEFQAFLDDVEQLSLKFSGKDHSGCNEPNDDGSATRNDDGRTSSNGNEIETLAKATESALAKEQKINVDYEANPMEKSTKKKIHHNIPKQEKKSMIRAADDSQRAWSDFQKLDLSAPSRGTSQSGNTENKPKISFQIMKATDKKKKSKKNKVIQGEDANEVKPSAVKGDQNANNKQEVSIEVSADGFRGDSCPRWILVIDTCCLIHDNGMDAQNLIDIANNAINARFMALQKAKANNAHAATMVTFVEEPIEIVIPYKVWGELEFQSKSQDSRTAFTARSVIRMLRDELAHAGRQSIMSSVSDVVIRSQTLMQSREASNKFLALDLASTPTNDDHILACAMMEHEIWNNRRNVVDATNNAAQAGGVVLLTTDYNLSCKALANHLRVDCPNSFQEYYVKRMESLRMRATQSLVGSALRM